MSGDFGHTIGDARKNAQATEPDAGEGCYFCGFDGRGVHRCSGAAHNAQAGTVGGDAEALAEVLRDRGETESLMWGSLELDPATYRGLARAVLASPWLAEQIAAAEQRGREDNADHGMCYVHGSKALAARDRAAEQRVAERAWGNHAVSDLRDVGNWLVREADQRTKFFPQRVDGVDDLMRQIAHDLFAAALRSERGEQ